MKLKIRVEDHDPNRNDFVELLRTYLDATPARSREESTESPVFINMRTK